MRPLRHPRRYLASRMLLAMGRTERVAWFREAEVPIIADLRTPTGLGLYRHGSIHDSALSWWASRVGPDDVVIDGGANIGLFTIAAAARGARTIAVEASPKTARRLRRNIEVSGVRGTTVVEEALGHEQATATFQEHDGAMAGLSSFAPAAEGSPIVVPVTTLDDVVGDLEVTLLKLDVEGAEVFALRGGRRVLERRSTHLLIEIEDEHLQRQGTSAEELRALLAEAGYRAEGFFEPSNWLYVPEP